MEGTFLFCGSDGRGLPRANQEGRLGVPGGAVRSPHGIGRWEGAELWQRAEVEQQAVVLARLRPWVRPRSAARGLGLRRGRRLQLSASK